VQDSIISRYNTKPMLQKITDIWPTLFGSNQQVEEEGTDDGGEESQEI